MKKINIDCPDTECEFYGGYGALGSADPLNQGTCLRGDGMCIKDSETDVVEVDGHSVLKAKS